MHRALKWIGWIVGILIALPVLALLLVVIVANTDFGRRQIERQMPVLTGGMVRIEGVAGRFPDSLRVRRIEVADAIGVYVSVDDAALDWSPSHLLHRTVAVDQLTASKLDFLRLPVASSSSSSSFTLPVQVDLKRLQVQRVIISEAVAGAAATLALEGSGHLSTLTEGSVQLTASRLDSPGEYTVSGTVAADHIQAEVQANEPKQGLIASIAKLPDLGAVHIQASVNGPKDALLTQAGVTAGPLRASASGTVDLLHEAANLTLHAEAPAMKPAPEVAWQSVLVDAKVHGPFTAPDADGTVRIRDLTAGTTRIGAINADISGNAGQVTLHAIAERLAVPGPTPDLLNGVPVQLDAVAQLSAPDRPVTFTLHHPLMTIDGTAKTAGTKSVRIHLLAPDLGPLAAVGNVDIHGNADLNAQATIDGDTTSMTLNGKFGVTGGPTPAPSLIGPDGTIELAAAIHGQDVTISKLEVNGKALQVSLRGGRTNDALDFTWGIKLADLAAVQPNISGKLDIAGHVSGALQDLTATADIGADIAAKGFSSGHITAKVAATDLADKPHATVTATGTLLDAPLSLALNADRIDGTVRATIERLAWKSLNAAGAFSLATGATVPTGSLRLTMTRLADLQPLLGRPIAGAATIALDADDKTAKANVALNGLSVPGTATAGKVVLAGTVTNPLDHPTFDATLTADGVTATATQGATARVTVKGPLDALGVTLTANAAAAAGAPARLAAAATVDAVGRKVALRTLDATWKQQTIRLLAPASLTFADGVAIDQLRIGFRQAVLALSGSVGTTLNLTATLRDLPADIGAIVDPSFSADGTIAADIRLTGTPAKPEGTVRLTADRVRMRRGPGQALPPATLVANATLQGTSARVDTRLTAGSTRLSATGSIPLSATGPINLSTDGRLDLAMLDPLLLAQGRRARGTVALTATIAGTATAPLVNGSVTLTGGDVADFGAGAHITDLTATLQASGNTITLSQFSGKAGPGTLGGSGTISLAGAMPVDLHFTANNARPIASDLVTAFVDANLTVQGEIKGNLRAGGTVMIRRADITIPETMPASVAVLPVRDPAVPPPPPAPPPTQSEIALDVTVNAPEQIFIRGRGLNAELGGRIHIGGTAANPLPSGALNLRRGTLSIIGTTLNFTSGLIDFNGAGLSNPALKFVAQSVNSTLVATMTVSGDIKHLKIDLSSVPDMPQDEILAQMLFNTDSSKLSPLQLAQIAAALAQLSGATSGIGDPLDKLRSSLGLDRLTVGSDSTGNPTLEAGRYISRRVYVGARQGTSGGSAQATIQVDLTKGLKLEATAGSGQTTATGATSSADAASVGLRYQFEY